MSKIEEKQPIPLTPAPEINDGDPSSEEDENEGHWRGLTEAEIRERMAKIRKPGISGVEPGSTSFDGIPAIDYLNGIRRVVKRLHEPTFNTGVYRNRSESDPGKHVE